MSLGKALRRHHDGHVFLIKLATHENAYMRIWAAKDCLECNAQIAVAVLQQIGEARGLALSARTALSECCSGRLIKSK